MYNFEGTKIQNHFLIDKYLFIFFLFSIFKKMSKNVFIGFLIEKARCNYNKLM